MRGIIITALDHGLEMILDIFRYIYLFATEKSFLTERLLSLSQWIFSPILSKKLSFFIGYKILMRRENYLERLASNVIVMLKHEYYVSLSTTHDHLTYLKCCLFQRRVSFHNDPHLMKWMTTTTREDGL